MKNLFTMIAAVAFSFSVAAGGCGKEKSPPPPQPAKSESAGTERKAAPRPRAHLFAGTIEALDPTAGTLTLSGPKGVMDFQANEKAKQQLADLKIGEKVIVKHVDSTALSIVRPRTSKNPLPTEEKGGR